MTGHVHSGYRHDLQITSRSFGWYARELVTLASLAGCVLLLAMWVLP